MSTDPPTIDPRKRPRQARAAATFDAILEAAARILEKDGIESVNTNAVAELAGVSVGSLYQYFPTKESILAELVRFNRSILKEKVETAVAQGTGKTLEETIDLLLDAAVLHQLERPELALKLEQVESVLPLDNETVALTEAIADDVAKLLSAHNVSDPDQASRDIVALVRGIVDAAGLAKEVDQAGLHRRLRRAVLGYLS
ncbi:MAG: TetR/AcrR family transcriptional regulator [Gammaproteobacteria bacterium]|nr:TetR/AcrR family transcriptional regulator [Gammaproteobacteria bacterium]